VPSAAWPPPGPSTRCLFRLQVKDESILKDAISMSKTSVVSWVEQQAALLQKDKQFVFRVAPRAAEAH
jgi:hypothetical protein